VPVRVAWPNENGKHHANTFGTAQGILPRPSNKSALRGETQMVPLRFEVSLNGRRLCVAGLDQLGVLMVEVKSENWPGPDATESARGTPAGDENAVFVQALTDDGEDWRWVHERITSGDEIVIRVLAVGPFDPPREFGPPEDE